MVVKATAVLVGVGLLSVGSVALAKPDLLGMMPHYTTLDASASVNTTSKWVDAHKKHFVDSNNNDDWFEWSFKNRYEKDIYDKKGKLKGLKTGRGNTTDNSLAKACKEAYGASNDDVKAKDTDATGDKFWEDEIWKYCSAAGSKPKATGQ